VPRVSVIVPAYQEAEHIEPCVRSILEQEVDGGLEVIVADGGSTDGTADSARAAGALVLDNAERTIPRALNLCLAAAGGETIVRFDAHAEMPPGYVRACLRALAEEPGAGNVGGWRDPRGSGPWGRAVGAALASRAGVGNPRIWRRPHPLERRRDVDTVPLGCWPASLLRELGGWREGLLANEDYELNHRLRRHGFRVVFDPQIWSTYRPRESLPAISRQYWRYGSWKAAMLSDEPGSLRPRQLAPVGLVAAVTLMPVSRNARRAVGAYALGLAAVSARAGGGWRVAPTLAVMHAAWGAGAAAGLARRVARRRQSAPRQEGA
jgi:succinoglycan biosynthesis protein ExoA